MYQETAINIVHYLSPPCVIAAYYSALVAHTLLSNPTDCSNKQPNKPQSHRLLITWAVSSIAASFIVECCLTLQASLQESSTGAAQDYSFYLLYSSFAWLLIASRNVSVDKSHLWSAAAALVSECSLLSLINARPANHSVILVRAFLATRLVRCLLAALTVTVYATYALHEKDTDTNDGEIEPLLGNGKNGVKGPHNRHGTSSKAKVDSSDDAEEDGDHYMKKIRQKQLAESGSLWNYIKQFKILIPYVVPLHQPKIQFCAAISLACIGVRRLLNILVAQQLGSITDEIAKGMPYGLVVPYKMVGIWLLLEVLDSRVGVSLVAYLTQLPLSSFTYESLSMAAFRHSMSLSMSFHTDKNSVELRKAVEQGRSIEDILDMALFTLLPTCLDVALACGYMFYLFDVYISFVVFMTGALYTLIEAKALVWTADYRRARNEKSRQESMVMNQALSSWITVAHFNRFEYEDSRFAKAVRENWDTSTLYSKKLWLYKSPSGVMDSMAFAIIASMITFRIYRGTSPIGSFVTFLSYWSIISGPLVYLSSMYRHFTEYFIDAERMLLLMQTESTVKNKPEAYSLPPGPGRVEYRNVSFAYDQRKPTLHGISFVAEPGKTIALVGETGSGKSTMLKLLSRFYDVGVMKPSSFDAGDNRGPVSTQNLDSGMTSANDLTLTDWNPDDPSFDPGSIFVDGNDIRDITQSSLRSSIGVVPQDPALFNSTVRDNVRYAVEGATDADVEEACRAAAIHDKILGFPDGYESKVGERGVKLSGGKLQRVAIARVFMLLQKRDRKRPRSADPRIIMLDEATSAVDTGTESKIQQALCEALAAAKCTTFVIAHRLSTVVAADEILVMHEGKIVERGRHEELLGVQGGRYKALWEKQVFASSSGDE